MRTMFDGIDIPIGDDGMVAIKDIDFMTLDCSSLIFPMMRPIEMKTPCRAAHYQGYHLIMASLGLEGLSNNFLKMHGCPMRRRSGRRRNNAR